MGKWANRQGHLRGEAGRVCPYLATSTWEILGKLHNLSILHRLTPTIQVVITPLSALYLQNTEAWVRA